MAFCELFCLLPTFLLPLSNNFQLSLPSFFKLLPNPREAIATLQLVLKSSMVPHTLDLLYFTSAETAATNKAINVVVSEFVAKVTNNENKHLRRHTVWLINNLELTQSLYLTEYNLTSIAPVVRFLEQTCTIGEQFNNLPSTGQVQMVHAILNEEEIHLYAMIRTILEQINIILQEQKSL